MLAQGMSAGRMDRGPKPAAPPPAALATLVYRSRAVQSFSPTDLLGLTQAAQKRNRAESVTGMVLYDDSRFFQWLEGPEDNLSRIMDSINNDGRHTDIEVLARQRTRQRTFAGWDMKLALPGAAAAPWTREVITPSLETVESLRRRPEIAPSVLQALAPPGAGRMQAILESVIRTRVIPQFVTLHRPRPEPTPPHPSAAELAEMLARGDTEAALAALHGHTYPAQAHLAESAARHFGDLWLDDACSEFEVTSAICLMQTLLLRLEQARPTPVRTGPPPGTVLVAPHPGEPHGLDASLSAHAFLRAGWAVRTEYPTSDAALEDLLSAGRFDTLALSLSPAFRREDRLPALARTITHAREASRNPALTVHVNGRIFREEPGAAAQVGADLPTRAPTGR